MKTFSMLVAMEWPLGYVAHGEIMLYLLKIDIHGLEEIHYILFEEFCNLLVRVEHAHDVEGK